MPFTRIAVFYNELKTHVAPLAQQAVALLRTQQVQATLVTGLDHLSGYDLVISMGGDGTMLRCARACAPKNIPVFGINCGTLGFLAAAEKEDLAQAFSTLLDDQCVLQQRLMLQITVRQNGQQEIFTALNDCVLHPATMRAFYIHATFNGAPMPSYFGDGVIVATPTGSTTILVAVVKGKDVTVEGINAAMKAASNESFGYTEDQIVSSDVIGMKFGSLFDATQTMVSKIDDETFQVQVVSWYDNENSYTSQMVRTIKYLAELK